MKKNSLITKEELILHTTYYNLYYQFLTLDKESLIDGRNDELITAFLFYHNALLKNDQKNIKEMRKKIVSALSENNIIPIKLNYDKKISKCKNNIELFFNLFYNSMGLFDKFRKAIGENNRKNIAIEMLQHRLQYYNFFKIDIETIQYNQQSCGITSIPLQTLNEFHNAMSHLCSIFISTGATESNVKRAENHLKRAILDLYKVIIKDFFIIADKNNDNTKQIIDTIKTIRELEYRTIGKDRIIQSNKKDIFSEYKKVCEKIIDFFNLAP